MLKSWRFVALLLVLASAGISAELKSQKPSGQDDARIDRIVNGLPPAVFIKGQPLPTKTLADRMKYYHVPGVSIAFFDHGRVVWARGYGLADVAANKPAFGGQFKVTITLRDNKLYVQYTPFGDEPQELLTESDSRLFMTSQPVVFDFQKEAGGSIKKAKIRNGPEQLDGEKVSEAPPE